MALELRPNCEYCDTDLPPSATDAKICTYECTFCATCVNEVLGNVCPNCGGGFESRPIRPRTEWRPGMSLVDRPASDRRVHMTHDDHSVAALRRAAEHIPPSQR